LTHEAITSSRLFILVLFVEANTIFTIMSHSTIINILMTGAGAPGAAGIIKCLQQNPSFNITVADADKNAIGQHLVKNFEIIPFAKEENFVEGVLAVCRKHNIHVLLPLVTKELIPLALHKKDFEANGVKVLVSKTSSLEIANNKSRLYEFLQWRGIDVPDFRIVETIDQFKTAAAELGYPGKTICFKPAEANGSRGFRIINADLDEAYLLFNEKPNAIFISYTDALRILSSKPFPELLVSEFLPGEEYSVDCLANNGDTIIALPRLRKKMINGITAEGEFVHDGNIINYCIQIIKELKLHGNIGIQVKKSSAGNFLILEINPRVQGTIAAALGAGVNLPAMAVKQELGLTITPEETVVKWGTKFGSYRTEVFFM
jgi:carbamoyl-phosphate synthase large subunit